MVELRPNWYDDEDYDGCGNTAIAILEIDRIKIPLCQECIDQLNSSLEAFNNTVFCYKCNNFIMSDSGWRYGGSCKLLAEKDGKVLEQKDAGYLYCKDCMDSCKDAKLKE